jgi:signal peptidase I
MDTEDLKEIKHKYKGKIIRGIAKTRIVQSVYDTASIMTTAVITIMLVFTFVIRIAGVVGPSMIPTLQDGDKLAVSAIISKPKVKDVIIITQPNDFHEPIVKRIIAMGGQKVNIDFDKGLVYVDGKLQDESFTNDGNGSTTDKFDINFPITVPQGYVFVMGDNRHHSTDSRSSMIGFVNENYILGKVIGRIMPIGSWHIQ